MCVRARVCVLVHVCVCVCVCVCVHVCVFVRKREMYSVCVIAVAIYAHAKHCRWAGVKPHTYSHTDNAVQLHVGGLTPASQ